MGITWADDVTWAGNDEDDVTLSLISVSLILLLLITVVICWCCSVVSDDCDVTPFESLPWLPLGSLMECLVSRRLKTPSCLSSRRLNTSLLWWAALLLVVADDDRFSLATVVLETTGLTGSAIKMKIKLTPVAPTCLYGIAQSLMCRNLMFLMVSS